MALQPWQKGKVIQIDQVNDYTKRFWIQAIEQESFDFLPGQFVTLDLPIHEKPNKRVRSYSIASWPNHSNVFELCIETNFAGAGSGYMFEQVHEGAELTFRGPAGVFTLPASLDKNTFFITEKSGIVPFRSMFHGMVEKHIHHEQIHLFYAGKNQSDLLYHDELREFEALISEFTYHPVLYTSDISQIIAVYAAEIQSLQTSTDQLPELHFYLCGWKEFTDVIKADLLARGFPKNNITQELYG